MGESCLGSCPSSVKVLDFGAGAGRNAIFLADKGYQVTAVDKNLDTLNKIPERSNLSTKCLDVTKWQIPETFDFVIATNILHFFDTKTACDCLDNIIKATSKNGIIAFSYILDNKEMPSGLLEKLTLHYQQIASTTKTVNDLGHPGMAKPHKHQIFYFLGRKI